TERIVSGPPPDDVDLSAAQSIAMHSLACHRAREGGHAATAVRGRSLDSRRTDQSPLVCGAGRRGGSSTSAGPAIAALITEERTRMHVGIATDHGGVRFKEELINPPPPPRDDVVGFGAAAVEPHDDFPGLLIPPPPARA